MSVKAICSTSMKVLSPTKFLNQMVGQEHSTYIPDL